MTKINLDWKQALFYRVSLFALKVTKVTYPSNFHEKEYISRMSTGLKALGIIGAGAVLALGISASEPTPATTVTPSAVVVPKTTEPTPTEDSEPAKPVIKTVPKPAVTETKPISSCHPSYSDCLKMNVGDYDCANGSGNGPNYTGPVQVYGSDPFDLDRDNDGWGCE